ncbi:hypothetical protein CASFOL_033517 [Castilleja foliolosa]|uniref:Retrotransposon Copia-like N-terminal domain-containing protein n=1 Tax=Castilleja foliolosa TaxID=1961234 RepID=A0ABD3BYU7_9LAMI
MVGSPNEPGSGNTNETSVYTDEELSLMAKILKNEKKQNYQVEKYQQYHYPLNIEPKLDDSNYSLWSRKLKLSLGGRGKWHHIEDEPPKPTEPHYKLWQQSDLQVVSWMVDSLSPDLVGQFIEYQTARELWTGINQTYRSGEDALQIYDLNIQASRLFQGEQTLEKYYQMCQSLWREIDRRDPNDMDCPNDISKYNKKVQTFRLYQFIHGDDVTFDAVKRDLLKEHPLPTVEMAYSALRREAARVVIVNRQTNQEQIGSGLTAREVKFCVVRNCFRVQIALTRVVVSLEELILSEKR